MSTRTHPGLAGGALILLPLVILLATLFLGRYPISPAETLQVLRSLAPWSELDPAAVHRSVVLYVRLPRALLAMLVGAALATSGAAFQGLFRNPLVSSGILGVSAGAGFGAALAIIFVGTAVSIYLSSFAFGILAVSLSFAIGRVYKVAPTITLVLGGVIVGSVFQALISLAKFVADPYEQLPAIVFWLMGSVATAEYREILVSAVPMAVGMFGLFLLRWRINVLSMGEREAQTLGANVRVSRVLLVASATLATAGSVSVAGVVGWVGLVMPHIGRMIVGSDNRYLVPASVSLGASFLLVVDNLARLLSASEIPLGILTALVGGPFFVYLLKRTRGAGWE